MNRIGTKVKTIYRDYDILLEEENGWYYYSILSPLGKEIHSGFVQVDQPLSSMAKELHDKVDNHCVAMSIEEYVSGKYHIPRPEDFLGEGANIDTVNHS